MYTVTHALKPLPFSKHINTAKPTVVYLARFLEGVMRNIHSVGFVYFIRRI